MKVIYSKHFLKSASHLPESIQNKLDELLPILAENPFHPLLHSKPLMGRLHEAHSFRITRDWRVIFVFESEDIIRLVTVGHRKEIYRSV